MNDSLTVREQFRKKVRNICDSLEFFDNLKEEIRKTNIDRRILVQLDNQIRSTERELAEISLNMADIDTCNCDGITEGCSSPLCPSQYDLPCNNPYA